jgi:2'-5' RNA ligase
MRLSSLFEAKKKLKHVGIFIKLPTDLNSKFPTLKEDDSPAHITTLYLGSQDYDMEDKIIISAYEVAENIEPFECELNGLGYFPKNQDGVKVAFVKVKSSGLHSLRNKLVKSVNEHKVEWENTWPEFKPHVTLAYMEDLDAEYGKKIPTGKWTCGSMEVWGFDKKHKIEFKKKQ